MQNNRQLQDVARDGALELLNDIIQDFMAYGSKCPNQDEVTISKNQLLLQLELWKNHVLRKAWTSSYDK